MILVTGATGTVGREVVKQLAAANQKVAALARPERRGGDLRRRNVSLIHGDLDDAASMRAALRNIDAVYLLVPGGPDMAQQEANVIDAALKAGTVDRIVLHSSSGVGHDDSVRFLRQHSESEQKLRESGIAWTILRPTFFMSNLLNYAPMIRAEGRLYAPAGDRAAPFIDPVDVAAAAVAALTKPKQAGETYELTGPEALTYVEAAKRIGAAIGRPVEYVNVKDDVAREAMVRAGVPEWSADGVIELYRALREGRTGEVTDDFERLVGRPPRSLDAFLHEHVDAFLRPEGERPQPGA
jgi:uncharacterized protein YbjT (DUF2867 family)